MLPEDSDTTPLVLDLGTKDGHKVTGIPAEVVAVDVDGSQFPEETTIEFVLADGHSLPFDADSFDVVYCSSVLEHVADADELVREASRVLHGSGTAYFSFPNRLSLLQPHAPVPRYYSLLPKPVGELLGP